MCRGKYSGHLPRRLVPKWTNDPQPITTGLQQTNLFFSWPMSIWWLQLPCWEISYGSLYDLLPVRLATFWFDQNMILCIFTISVWSRSSIVHSFYIVISDKVHEYKTNGIIRTVNKPMQSPCLRTRITLSPTRMTRMVTTKFCTYQEKLFCRGLCSIPLSLDYWSLDNSDDNFLKVFKFNQNIISVTFARLRLCHILIHCIVDINGISRQIILFYCIDQFINIFIMNILNIIFMSF